MKRTILAIALALVISAAFVSGVIAQQSSPPAAQTSEPSPPAKMEKFSGTIQKLDEAAKEIVVKKGSDEKTFSWDDQTKFMQGKKHLAFSDLKKGERVSIRYRTDGTKLTADKIYVSMKATSHKKSM